MWLASGNDSCLLVLNRKLGEPPFSYNLHLFWHLLCISPRHLLGWFADRCLAARPFTLRQTPALTAKVKPRASGWDVRQNVDMRVMYCICSGSSATSRPRSEHAPEPLCFCLEKLRTHFSIFIKTKPSAGCLPAENR